MDAYVLSIHTFFRNRAENNVMKRMLVSQSYLGCVPEYSGGHTDSWVVLFSLLAFLWSV